MKNKSLEQKNVQNENKMRGNVWKFLWTPKLVLKGRLQSIISKDCQPA